MKRKFPVQVAAPTFLIRRRTAAALGWSAERRMEAGAEARWCLNELARQNGLTTARITMPIIKTVGISLIMR